MGDEATTGAGGIPGIEDVADVPQGQISPGNAGFEYNLANFNALAVANAEMQGELAAVAATVEGRDGIISELRERANRTQQLLNEARGEIEVLRVEGIYDRERREVAEKRLERFKGWADRVLEEDGVSDPVEQPRVAQRGPHINDIRDAQPRGPRSDGAAWDIIPAVAGRFTPGSPIRNY